MEKSKSISTSSSSNPFKLSITPNTSKLSRKTVTSHKNEQRIIPENSDTEVDKHVVDTNKNNNNNSNNNNISIKEPFRRNVGFRKSETSIRVRSSVNKRSLRTTLTASSSSEIDEDSSKVSSSKEQLVLQPQQLEQRSKDSIDFVNHSQKRITKTSSEDLTKSRDSLNDDICSHNMTQTYDRSPKGDRKRDRRSPSPRISRGRRSRSPTNTIIVRRKSIKSITLPPKAGEIEDQNEMKTRSLENLQMNTSSSVNVSNSSLTDVSTSDKKNNQQTTSTLTTTENKPQALPPTTMQRTTADGKPIGYATKIMGSPTTTLRHHATTTVRHQHRHHHHQQDQREHVNTGDVIPDSPEKIQNDLDSYIEQSFRDIDKSVRSSSRRYRRQHGTDSDGASDGVAEKEKDQSSDITELRRERRREKNRERQMRLLAENKNNNNNNNNNNNDEVFSQNIPELPNRVTADKHSTQSTSSSDNNRVKLQSIKSQEEVKDFNRSKTNSLETQTKDNNNNDDKHKDSSVSTTTMDTMKEFEEFLKKQERKTKREMRRLSRNGSCEDLKSQSHDSLSTTTTTTSNEKDFTVERYRVRQQRRRQERKEFQEKHLLERRLSLGNKWPSLGSIRGPGKPTLQRKLSLPSNLNHTQRFARSSSSLSTTSSTESLDDENLLIENRAGMIDKRTPSGRHSAPPVSSPSSELTRRHTFSGMTNKERSNSTGHSPDMDSLLQHLICDIEEEIVNSDDENSNTITDDGQGIHFKTQQLESFNSNLNELKSQSEEALYKSQSLPRRTSKGLVRRFMNINSNEYYVGRQPVALRGSRVS